MMISHLRIKLKSSPSKFSFFSLGNSNSLSNFSYFFRNIFPSLSLLSSRFDVIFYFAPIQFFSYFFWPPIWKRSFSKPFQPLQSFFQHPLRLIFISGNLSDKFFIQSFSCLKLILHNKSIIVPAPVNTKILHIYFFSHFNPRTQNSLSFQAHSPQEYWIFVCVSCTNPQTFLLILIFFESLQANLAHLLF